MRGSALSSSSCGVPEANAQARRGMGKVLRPCQWRLLTSLRIEQLAALCLELFAPAFLRCTCVDIFFLTVEAHCHSKTCPRSRVLYCECAPYCLCPFNEPPVLTAHLRFIQDHVRGRRHARRLQYIGNMPESERTPFMQRVASGIAWCITSHLHILPAPFGMQ